MFLPCLKEFDSTKIDQLSNKLMKHKDHSFICLRDNRLRIRVHNCLECVWEPKSYNVDLLAKLNSS